MENITEDVAFVNDQILFHQKRAAAFASTEWRHKLHLSTSVKFQHLLETMLALQKEAEQSAAAPQKILSPGQQLALTFQDVEGLPEELVQELSISETDKTEFMITSMIENAGGIMSLDRLLIAIFKETGEILKRQNLTNRLYRMGQKGLVYSVPGKKGAYSTEELTPEQVEKLLNPKA